MKKLFLVLLSGGIMMTACKKEEMKTATNLQNDHLKTTPVSNFLSSYVLVNSDTIVDGVLSDEYRNLYDGSSLFMGKKR